MRHHLGVFSCSARNRDTNVGIQIGIQVSDSRLSCLLYMELVSATNQPRLPSFFTSPIEPSLFADALSLPSCTHSQGRWPGSRSNAQFVRPSPERIWRTNQNHPARIL